MQCAEYQSLLSDYLDGDLSETERRAADAHMRDCARCATVRNDLARIIHASASLPVQTPSPRVWEGIRREIAGGSSVVSGPKAWWDRAGARRFEFSVSARQLAAAAAGVIVLAGTFWMLRSPSTIAPVAQVSPASPTPPEQPSTLLSYTEGQREISELRITIDGMSREVAKREPSWSPELRETYRSTLAGLDAKIAAFQLAYDDAKTDASRQPLLGALRDKLNALEEFARVSPARTIAK